MIDDRASGRRTLDLFEGLERRPPALEARHCAVRLRDDRRQNVSEVVGHAPRDWSARVPAGCLDELALQPALLGDVDDSRPPLARGFAGARALEARHDQAAAAGNQAELEGLALAGGEHGLLVGTQRFDVCGYHEGGQALADELLLRHAQKLRERPVRVRDSAGPLDCVADGRQLEQVAVAFPGCLELLKREAQLLVLHLQLDLVDAELVLYLELVRERRRCRRPCLELLLGAFAQPLHLCVHRTSRE